jgi:hypothetical protein
MVEFINLLKWQSPKLVQMAESEMARSPIVRVVRDLTSLIKVNTQVIIRG